MCKTRLARWAVGLCLVSACSKDVSNASNHAAGEKSQQTVEEKENIQELPKVESAKNQKATEAKPGSLAQTSGELESGKKEKAVSKSYRLDHTLDGHKHLYDTWNKKLLKMRLISKDQQLDKNNFNSKQLASFLRDSQTINALTVAECLEDYCIGFFDSKAEPLNLLKELEKHEMKSRVELIATETSKEVSLKRYAAFWYPSDSKYKRKKQTDKNKMLKAFTTVATMSEGLLYEE